KQVVLGEERKFLESQNLTCSIRICNYVNNQTNKEIRIAANQGLRMVGRTANRCLPGEKNIPRLSGGTGKNELALSCQGFHELRRAELVLPLTGCFVQFVTCVYPPALRNGLGKSSRMLNIYPFYELTVPTPIDDVQILLLSADLFFSDKQHRPYRVN